MTILMASTLIHAAITHQVHIVKPTEGGAPDELITVHKEALPVATCVYCAWDPGTERHLALALRGNGVVLWQARARPSRCSSIIGTPCHLAAPHPLAGGLGGRHAGVVWHGVQVVALELR